MCFHDSNHHNLEQRAQTAHPPSLAANHKHLARPVAGRVETEWKIPLFLRIIRSRNHVIPRALTLLQRPLLTLFPRSTQPRAIHFEPANTSNDVRFGVRGAACQYQNNQYNKYNK